MNLKERTYLWYVAILRIYVGYYMLLQGIRKFQRDFPRGDWIGRQIGDLAAIDLLTRLSAVVGLFMLINYYLGPGMARGGAMVAQQQTFIVSMIIFILSNPGRTLGLD